MTISDLSPDALARLEAKLVADLEMVRKVRALLEEHRGMLGTPAAPVTPPAMGAAAPAAATAPVAPRKTFDEILMESLLSLPETGFTIGDLKRKLHKAGCDPRDSSVKTFLNRMIRQGKVQVLEARTGRGGSTYICSLPRPEPTEKVADSSEKPADSPVSPPESPVVQEDISVYQQVRSLYKVQ